MRPSAAERDSAQSTTRPDCSLCSAAVLTPLARVVLLFAALTTDGVIVLLALLRAIAIDLGDVPTPSVTSALCAELEPLEIPEVTEAFVPAAAGVAGGATSSAAKAGSPSVPLMAALAGHDNFELAVLQGPGDPEDVTTLAAFSALLAEVEVAGLPMPADDGAMSAFFGVWLPVRGAATFLLITGAEAEVPPMALDVTTTGAAASARVAEATATPAVVSPARRRFTLTQASSLMQATNSIGTPAATGPVDGGMLWALLRTDTVLPDNTEVALMDPVAKSPRTMGPVDGGMLWALRDTQALAGNAKDPEAVAANLGTLAASVGKGGVPVTGTTWFLDALARAN